MKSLFRSALLALPFLLTGLHSMAAKDGKPTEPYNYATSAGLPVGVTAPAANTIIICSGNDIKLKYDKATGTNPDPNLKYEWSKDDGAAVSVVETNTGNNKYQEPAPQPGKFNYKLRVINENDCSSEFADYTVYVLPPFTVSLDDAKVCSSETGNTSEASAKTTTLTATVKDGDGNDLTAKLDFSYAWTEAVPSGTATAISGNDSKSYTVADKTTTGDYVYTITAKYKDATYAFPTGASYKPCSSTDNGTVTVILLPGKPSISTDY